MDKIGVFPCMLMREGSLKQRISRIIRIFQSFLQRKESLHYTQVNTVLLASFRFEDDDENEDQVQLLLIVHMLKSVTVMA